MPSAPTLAARLALSAAPLPTQPRPARPSLPARPPAGHWPPAPAPSTQCAGPIRLPTWNPPRRCPSLSSPLPCRKDEAGIARRTEPTGGCHGCGRDQEAQYCFREWEATPRSFGNLQAEAPSSAGPDGAGGRPFSGRSPGWRRTCSPSIQRADDGHDITADHRGRPGRAAGQHRHDGGRPTAPGRPRDPLQALLRAHLGLLPVPLVLLPRSGGPREPPPLPPHAIRLQGKTADSHLSTLDSRRRTPISPRSRCRTAGGSCSPRRVRCHRHLRLALPRAGD